MPSLVVSQLQRCTGLTQLGIEIEHEDSWIEGTAVQFAQALAQLKQLRELRLAGYGFTFEDEDARFHHMCDTQLVLSSLTQLPGLRSLALLRLDLTDDRAVPAGATILDDLGLLKELSRLELECCETWSEHELYPSCLCQALLQLTRLTQLHVLRMALHPAMVDGWAAKHAAQMGQLQRVECFVEDFGSAKLSWACRPDVRVEHIEPDGSTTHVCGGGCLEG
uniref:Uncharacterized protein n=1 Tax=Tetradesmus obliquus TaxID=3088 RepID=A0A383WEN5_TETOB|eukprot:jgi/Sobl393_1/4942/SZX75622.1